MERPKRITKKPKQIYEPDPDVKLEGDDSDNSDFDVDEEDLEDIVSILTDSEEESDDEPNEYVKDDFLVSDNDSLGELSIDDDEESWVDSEEESSVMEISEDDEDLPSPLPQE